MATVAKIKDDPPPPASLSAAMAVAFAEIDGATKTASGQVGQQKYKYADLTAVIEAVKPALIRNGLFFTQHPEPSERGVTVETWLHHASGESLSLGKLFVPANKQDAQGYGSALTYARRYALVTAFGVPVEDDDGNAAARSAGGQSKESAVNPPPITDADWAKITQLVQATNSNVPLLLKAVNSPATQLDGLTRDEFDRAVAALENKLATMARAETNAKGRANG